MFMYLHVSSWSLRASRGSRRCQAESKEVPGSQGKPRAPERWPESSGRSLDDDFQVEAFFCQISLFSVLRGRLQEDGGEKEEEEEEEKGEEPDESKTRPSREFSFTSLPMNIQPSIMSLEPPTLSL